jgi:uncharacterized membrane protein YjjP (DUF1212 family)
VDAPDPYDAGDVRDLMVQLGTAMLAAGDSVDAVSSTLSGILRAYGLGKSAVLDLDGHPAMV